MKSLSVSNFIKFLISLSLSLFNFHTHLLIVARNGSGPQTQTRADFLFSLLTFGRLLSSKLLPTLPLRPFQLLLGSERMWVTLSLKKKEKQRDELIMVASFTLLKSEYVWP